MPILIFISLFTLLDFVLLFSIGSQIGLLMTLLIVLGTGFAGLYLMQKEGMSTFARARKRIQMGEIPSNELFTGAALIFAGALLLAPGFLSDALGIACLLPTARQLGVKAMTWLGLKTAGKRQYQEAASHHQSSPHDEHSTPHQEGPLEGDFISRDESTSRR